jgi:hypothetical protein
MAELSLGEIRYVVYEGRRGHPFVCRLKLDSISPKGHHTYWKPLDIPADRCLPYPVKDLPAATIPEAVRQFQRWQLGVFFAGEGMADHRVRLIVKAEELLETEESGEGKADSLQVDGT